jgi:Asp-tRNA(Asn)/Glu-tRNA(Gln) amidotransferase A subunit family amidase
VVDDTPPPYPPKPLSSCTFAYVKTDQWQAGSGPSPELERAWAKSKELLIAAGATVTDVDLPVEFNDVMPRTVRLMASEGRVNFLPEYMVSKDKLDPLLISHVENQTKISRREQLDIYDAMAALRPKLDAIAGQYDAIVTPSVPGEAWVGIERTGDARFCALWTSLHVPCINIPGFASESGMPIGLTLVAPR